MLHNPIVRPADVAAGFWLKSATRGIMPVIAAQPVAGGYDSRGRRVAAGLAAHAARAASAAHSRGPWWTLEAGSPAVRLPVPGAAVGAE
jgi:hypothetical protein